MPAEPSPQGSPEDGEEYESAPWHFKLLLIAFVLYLIYRLIQLIIWGFGHVF